MMHYMQHRESVASVLLNRLVNEAGLLSNLNESVHLNHLVLPLGP